MVPKVKANTPASFHRAWVDCGPSSQYGRASVRRRVAITVRSVLGPSCLWETARKVFDVGIDGSVVDVTVDGGLDVVVVVVVVSEDFSLALPSSVLNREALLVFNVVNGIDL